MEYKGEFMDGKKHGHGKMTWPDGSRLEGIWVNGHILKGTCEISGNIYEGEFSNNLRNGYGIFTFVNGDKYDGNWCSDLKHGSGVFFFKNGDSIRGTWANDKLLKGTWTTKNRVYSGEFEDGLEHGKGKAIMENGESKNGTWRKGSMIKGEEKYRKGDIYVGEFEGDFRHGNGKFTFANGETREGTWVRDEMVKGELILETGETYVGQFMGCFRHGQGILTYKDKNKDTVMEMGTWSRNFLNRDCSIFFKDNYIDGWFRGGILVRGTRYMNDGNVETLGKEGWELRELRSRFPMGRKILDNPIEIYTVNRKRHLEWENERQRKAMEMGEKSIEVKTFLRTKEKVLSDQEFKRASIECIERIKRQELLKEKVRIESEYVEKGFVNVREFKFNHYPSVNTQRDSCVIS